MIYSLFQTNPTKNILTVLIFARHQLTSSSKFDNNLTLRTHPFLWNIRYLAYGNMARLLQQFILLIRIITVDRSTLSLVIVISLPTPQTILTERVKSFI